MSPSERENHCYLGDGVYAEHTPENLILRTGSHMDQDCDNIIYLDHSVLKNLARVMAHWTKYGVSKNERN